MGNILFVLIQYLLAKAAGVPSGLLPSKKLELPEVEKNFFDPNYYARRTVSFLKRAFETFFGTTALAIFFTSGAYLFFAALVCLAVLLVKYVGAGELLGCPLVTDLRHWSCGAMICTRGPFQPPFQSARFGH